MAEASVEIGETLITVVEGDLTVQQVDAVVNAANEWLKHGGGVAAAIVRAGGAIIQEESDAYVEACGALPVGTAAVTSAGNMAAHWVVHTVGPRYQEGHDNERLLRAAVFSALDMAALKRSRSVALPAISAGIFGYPRSEATAVICSEVIRWVRQHPGAMDEVRLVGRDSETVDDFASGLAGDD